MNNFYFFCQRGIFLSLPLFWFSLHLLMGNAASPRENRKVGKDCIQIRISSQLHWSYAHLNLISAAASDHRKVGLLMRKKGNIDMLKELINNLQIEKWQARMYIWKVYRRHYYVQYKTQHCCWKWHPCVKLVHLTCGAGRQFYGYRGVPKR